MGQDRNKTGLIIGILLLVILVLVAVLAYVFLISPKISGYAVNNQIQGYQIAINEILAQIQQNGYVQIPVSENQSVILVPYQEPQQTQQMPATEQ